MSAQLAQQIAIEIMIKFMLSPLAYYQTKLLGKFFVKSVLEDPSMNILKSYIHS